MSELRGIQKRLAEFQSRQVAVVAISADSAAESKKLSESEGYKFTMLTDPKTEVIRQYGLLHAKGGPDGHDIARPAELLVDQSRTIRWANFTEDLKVRARADQLLRAIDALPR